MGKIVKSKIEKVFDMIGYLQDGAVGEYKIKEGGKSYKPAEIQAFVQEKIQDFVVSAATKIETPNGKIGIQAFTGTTDLAVIDSNVWNAFQETPNFDLLWQRAFRGVPLRKGQLYWSVGTVISGTVLKLLEEGAKVDYAKIEGDTIKGSVDLYGSGLSMTWKTMEGRDLAGFFNAMLDFRNKRMKEYADAHYGLLAAAAATNPVAWQLTATDSTLDRDIATLNELYATIAEATEDMGFGDTANATMLLYIPLRLKARMLAAMNATESDSVRSGGVGTTVSFNIELLVTQNSAIPANKGVMVLPGNKIQNSVYMKEKNFERTDPDNLNWLKSSFTAFGAIVGENDQTAEGAFA